MAQLFVATCSVAWDIKAGGPAANRWSRNAHQQLHIEGNAVTQEVYLNVYNTSRSLDGTRIILEHEFGMKLVKGSVEMNKKKILAESSLTITQTNANGLVDNKFEVFLDAASNYKRLFNDFAEWTNNKWMSPVINPGFGDGSQLNEAQPGTSGSGKSLG